MQDIMSGPKSDDTDILMELLSSPPSNIIEQVSEAQKSRSKARLNPLFFSPTHNRDKCSEFHHITDRELSSRGSIVNPKNKHNKLRQVRNQYRYEKLLLQREKVTDKQFKQDVERKYDEQVREFLNWEDVNRLIEDERDILSENKRNSLELQEAEARAWEEEMELMELIESLDLNS